MQARRKVTVLAVKLCESVGLSTRAAENWGSIKHHTLTPQHSKSRKKISPPGKKPFPRDHQLTSLYISLARTRSHNHTSQQRKLGNWVKSVFLASAVGSGQGKGNWKELLNT